MANGGNKSNYGVPSWVVFLIILAIFFYSIIFAGKRCGGFAANLPEYQCPLGYECRMEDNYPDASGKCRFSLIFTFIELRNKYLR